MIESIILMILGVIPTGIFIIITVVHREKREKKLIGREQALSYFLVTNSRKFQSADESGNGVLVVGESCIASDTILKLYMGFRRLVGGTLDGYVKLSEDSRRLALVKMLEDARSRGYDAVCNVKIEACQLIDFSKRQDNRVAVSYIATGTAYRRRRAV